MIVRTLSFWREFLLDSHEILGEFPHKLSPEASVRRGTLWLKGYRKAKVIISNAVPDEFSRKGAKKDQMEALEED